MVVSTSGFQASVNHTIQALWCNYYMVRKKEVKGIGYNNYTTAWVVVFTEAKKGQGGYHHPGEVV